MTHSTGRRRGLVLLLLPERDDRDMYAEFLYHAGFTPAVVTSAETALRVAEDAAIVVTGVLVPGPFDGIEFVIRLKADERTKHVPVIVLTSCTWERDRAIAAGCDRFLSKPCLPDSLAREIRRLLSRRGGSQDLKNRYGKCVLTSDGGHRPDDFEIGGGPTAVRFRSRRTTRLVSS